MPSVEEWARLLGEREQQIAQLEGVVQEMQQQLHDITATVNAATAAIAANAAAASAAAQAVGAQGAGGVLLTATAGIAILAAASVKPPKPDNFHGRRDATTVDQWVYQMQNYLLLQGVPPQLQVSLAAAYF